VQYTLRNIPPNVDRALRRKAKESGTSFNQVAVEALTRGAGEAVRPQRDFSFIVGSLPKKEAAEIEAELKAQRQLDPKLWK
jgi:hypothetical protein